MLEHSDDTLSANVVNLFPKHYQISEDQQDEKKYFSKIEAIFCQKMPSKQLLMITGQELSDELSGSSLASILSDRWPLEFFSDYHDKLPKTDIFCFLANYLRFCC